MQETAEAAAQSVLDSVAADAAAFPIFEAIIAWLVATFVMWSVVEVMKATAIAKLKRSPPKTATERTVLKRISKQFPWYPVLIWGVSLVGGAAIGVGVGALGALGMGYGAAFGALAVLNGLWMKALRKIGDKASDLLLGWLKRRVGNGNGE